MKYIIVIYYAQTCSIDQINLYFIHKSLLHGVKICDRAERCNSVTVVLIAGRNHFPVTSRRNLSGTVTYNENSYVPRLKTRGSNWLERWPPEILRRCWKSLSRLPESGRSLANDRRVAALRNIPFATKLFPLFAHLLDERDKRGIGTKRFGAESAHMMDH